MYIFFFLIFFATAILIIRVLIFRGHKASTQLPIFKSNYCQAVCTNDECPLNETRYYPPERHNKMLILLHRLSLRPGDVKGKTLKCPWCGGTLTIEPLGPLFKSPPPGKDVTPLPWDNKTNKIKT